MAAALARMRSATFLASPRPLMTPLMTLTLLSRIGLKTVWRRIRSSRHAIATMTRQRESRRSGHGVPIRRPLAIRVKATAAQPPVLFARGPSEAGRPSVRTASRLRTSTGLPGWSSTCLSRRSHLFGAGSLRPASGDAPGLVAGEEVRRRATVRLPLEIDVNERLPVGVAHDEAGQAKLWRLPGGLFARSCANATAPHRREVLSSFRCKVFREPRYFGSRSEIQIRPRPQRVIPCAKRSSVGDSDG